MNKLSDGENEWPSVSESDAVFRVLHERGVIGINCDEWQCKRKLVELGLSLPDGKSHCLIYGKERQESLYLFVCVRDSKRGSSAPGFRGFRFDIAKYRSNPLEGLGVGEAFLAFMGAVATLEGFDLTQCTLAKEEPFQN
jgi:hypothetical protein